MTQFGTIIQGFFFHRKIFFLKNDIFVLLSISRKNGSGKGAFVQLFAMMNSVLRPETTQKWTDQRKIWFKHSSTNTNYLVKIFPVKIGSPFIKTFKIKMHHFFKWKNWLTFGKVVVSDFNSKVFQFCSNQQLKFICFPILHVKTGASLSLFNHFSRTHAIPNSEPQFPINSWQHVVTFLFKLSVLKMNFCFLPFATCNAALLLFWNFLKKSFKFKNLANENVSYDCKSFVLSQMFYGCKSFVFSQTFSQCGKILPIACTKIWKKCFQPNFANSNSISFSIFVLLLHTFCPLNVLKKQTIFAFLLLSNFLNFNQFQHQKGWKIIFLFQSTKILWANCKPFVALKCRSHELILHLAHPIFAISKWKWAKQFQLFQDWVAALKTHDPMKTIA